MKKTKTLLFIFTLLLSFTGAFSQTFNKSTDLLLANYDLLPDMDDVHSIAAMGSMLKHEDYQDVNYWAVAGAYGKQTGYDYIHTVAPEFMTLCFGAQNVKWTDAHNDWSGSVTRVTAEVVRVLNAGGTVWVQEGGQSDFSYDVTVAAQAAGISATKIKNNFIIVQHSNWNTNQSTEKSWLNSGDVNYVKIADCNNAGNGTPAYKEAASSYITAAISTNNPNGYAQAFWDMANDICVAWDASNPTIVAGGIDFSDHGENWYIFGWDDKYMTVQEFMDEFVTNDPGTVVNFPPTVNFVTPTKTSYTIPEGSVGVDIVPVEISATDDGSISSVELYINNQLISSDASAPYTWTNNAALKNLTEGTYTLKAIAEDNGGQTSEAILTITVAPEDNEGNGVEYGDHWVVCEIENTKSPKGLWELRKSGDADYFEGASNGQYLEFTGNTPPGSGSDRSPLTYTFTAPKTAQYELLMRYHQNLDNGVGGTYAGDYCNDAYVTMAGNFTSGTAALSEAELRTEQKFFGKGRDWGVGYRITMYTDGEKNYPAKYNLIEGEEYTFTIAGRSKQTCIDYWLFVDNSEIADMPTAQMDMYTVLDAKYRPSTEVIDPTPVTGVTVSPESATLTSVGATQQLTKTILPSNATNKSVSWSSSDEAVATVSTNGLVTALANGTAMITATTEDGGFTDTTEVTVNEVVVPPTGNLALNGTASQSSTGWSGVASRANDGNTSGLWADGSVSHTTGGEVNPWWEVDLGAEYSIGDINIFGRIDDCCANRLSDYTLYVIDTNGETTYSENFTTYPEASTNAGDVLGQIIRIELNTTDVALALAEVEVYEGEDPAISVTEVILTPASVSLDVEQTEQLSVAVLPTDATNTDVTWSSSDDGIATVNASGLVTAQASGTAIITVTSIDGGHTANSSITVNEVVVPPTSDNLALNKTATQSSTGWSGVASRANDGNTSGSWADGSVSHTTGGEVNPWWEVDLGAEFSIGDINIFGRIDACCADRLSDYTLYVIDANGETTYSENFTTYPEVSTNAGDVMGQIIRIQLNTTDVALALAEVQVYEGAGGDICATFARIESEDYNAMSGIDVGASGDTDGTDCVKDPHVGDWVMYSNIDLTCATRIDARVASYRDGGNIEVRIDDVDGTLIGTISQGTTGGWTNWVTASTNITETSGVHDVYLVFSEGSGRTLYLNWFEFSNHSQQAKSALTKNKLQNSVNKSFQIYPNPATTKLNIQLSSSAGVTKMAIFNTIGQMVISDQSINERHTVDISKLPTGTYIIKVTDKNNEQVLTKKFIKQ